MADRYRRTPITVPSGGTQRVSAFVASASFLPQLKSIGAPHTADVRLRVYLNDEMVAEYDIARSAGYGDFVPFDQPTIVDDRIDYELINNTAGDLTIPVITGYTVVPPA